MKVSKVLYTSKSINELKKLFHAVSFDITTLHKSFESGQLLPSQVITKSHQRISDDKASWIMQIPLEDVESEAQALDNELKELREKGKSFQDLLQKYPLFGIPFGVKDNIDVAGFPTTAGCPSFSRTPSETAPVVEQLKKAGAVLMGKQNLDQFAAGLVGVRSPYGIPENPFNAEYCPGGSSSGGGVSTSTHQVSFSIGTDTAGSGRIPACFNNIVGFKPTPRILSTRGLVPACRTLDCVSILALSCDDAWKVFTNCREYDPKDELARLPKLSPYHSKPLNFGIPNSKQLKFFGDTTGAKEAYLDGIELLKKTTGAVFTEIDFTPYIEVAKILYDGPWISERLSAITEFFDTRKDDLHPVTKGILERGKTFSGVDTFLGFRRLEKLKREAYEIWDEAKIDALVVPTASITPTIKEVMEVPTGINTILGLYTNFVNLLDLCAVSVPNFILPSGMPTGISIIGRAFDDHFIYQVGRLFQSARNLRLGAKEFLLPPESSKVKDVELMNEYVDVVVCDSHMRDLPLNKELLELEGRFVRSLKTKPVYSLYDISTEDQKRSALVRNEEDTGAPIRVEVWRIPRIKAGELLEGIRAPLVLGSVELEDGTSVKGFLCESYVVRKAKDVSSFGDWRAYLYSIRNQKH